VTSLAARPPALVAEPASRPAGKLNLLFEHEPPAQAGGFLFRTAML
jgi:hypothetical protein